MPVLALLSALIVQKWTRKDEGSSKSDRRKNPRLRRKRWKSRRLKYAQRKGQEEQSKTKTGQGFHEDWRYGQGRVKTIVKFILLNFIFFILAGIAAIISILASFAIY